MAESDLLAAFDLPTARRILQNTPNTSVTTPRTNSDGSEQFDGWILAYTTGGATARVGTTTGSGTAALKSVNSSGVIVDMGKSVTYRNWSASDVEPNRYIWLNRYGSHLFVVNVECVP